MERLGPNVIENEICNSALGHKKTKSRFYSDNSYDGNLMLKRANKKKKKQKKKNKKNAKDKKKKQQAGFLVPTCQNMF